MIPKINVRKIQTIFNVISRLIKVQLPVYVFSYYCFLTETPILNIYKSYIEDKSKTFAKGQLRIKVILWIKANVLETCNGFFKNRLHYY